MIQLGNRPYQCQYEVTNLRSFSDHTKSCAHSQKLEYLRSAQISSCKNQRLSLCLIHKAVIFYSSKIFWALNHFLFAFTTFFYFIRFSSFIIKIGFPTIYTLIFRFRFSSRYLTKSLNFWETVSPISLSVIINLFFWIFLQGELLHCHTWAVFQISCKRLLEMILTLQYSM